MFRRAIPGVLLLAACSDAAPELAGDAGIHSPFLEAGVPDSASPEDTASILQDADGSVDVAPPSMTSLKWLRHWKGDIEAAGASGLGMDLVLSGDFTGMAVIPAEGGTQVSLSAPGQIDAWIGRISGDTGDAKWLKAIASSGEDVLTAPISLGDRIVVGATTAPGAVLDPENVRHRVPLPTGDFQPSIVTLVLQGSDGTFVKANSFGVANRLYDIAPSPDGTDAVVLVRERISGGFVSRYRGAAVAQVPGLIGAGLEPWSDTSSLIWFTFSDTLDYFTGKVASQGSKDGFVMTFSGDATTALARFHGPGDDRITALAKTDNGFVVTLRASAGFVLPLSTSAGQAPLERDATIVAAYGTDGSLLWSASIDGSFDVRGLSASSDGRVTVAGAFDGAVTISSGASPPLKLEGATEGAVLVFDRTGRPVTAIVTRSKGTAAARFGSITPQNSLILGGTFSSDLSIVEAAGQELVGGGLWIASWKLP